MRRVTAGFSLIEVVIALAILAFALFGMISVITYSARTNKISKERMLAMRAAERKIEQMLSCTTFEDIYNKFSAPIEGQGWEQVQELDSNGVAQQALLPVALTAQDLSVPSGYQYYSSGAPPLAVLFVMFPLNIGGTGFDEASTAVFMGDPLHPAAPLDLDRDGVTTGTNVQVASCKVLPVSIMVYWKSGSNQKAYLNYKYTFLRKT
jgi:type II secretion system protein I